jgi:hypothetical protein
MRSFASKHSLQPQRLLLDVLGGCPALGLGHLTITTQSVSKADQSLNVLPRIVGTLCLERRGASLDEPKLNSVII